MDDCKVRLIPKSFQRRHGRMESEESVQIDHGILWNCDRRAQAVVSALAVGNDHVEPVGATSLKDEDQAPAVIVQVDAFIAVKERGHCSDSGERQNSTTNEVAPRHLHEKLRILTAG